MKPDWSQILTVLAKNLTEFPTEDDYGHHELAVTANLLLLAAGEFGTATDWRKQELEDLRRVLGRAAQLTGKAVAYRSEGPVEPAGQTVDDLNRALATARQGVIALQEWLEEPSIGGHGDLEQEVRDVLRSSIDRRSRILETTEIGW